MESTKPCISRLVDARKVSEGPGARSSSKTLKAANPSPIPSQNDSRVHPADSLIGLPTRPSGVPRARHAPLILCFSTLLQVFRLPAAALHRSLLVGLAAPGPRNPSGLQGTGSHPTSGKSRFSLCSTLRRFAVHLFAFSDFSLLKHYLPCLVSGGFCTSQAILETPSSLYSEEL